MYMNHVIFNTVSHRDLFCRMVPHPYIILMMCKYCGCNCFKQWRILRLHVPWLSSPFSFLFIRMEDMMFDLGDIQKVHKSPGWKGASNCKQVCSREEGGNLLALDCPRKIQYTLSFHAFIRQAFERNSKFMFSMFCPFQNARIMSAGRG